MLTALSVTVALLIVLYVGIGVLFYHIALDPKFDRARLLGTDAVESEADRIAFERDTSWLTERSGCRDREIVSFDGLRLHAYEVTQAGYRYAVLCHGYNAGGKYMSAIGERFFREGYSVLLPDARGHGESGGRYIGMGFHERRDIAQWVTLIASEHPDATIALYGVSMGGATVMLTAGEPLPKNVRAIVEDCGYSSIRAEFTHQLKTLFHLPVFPVLYAADLISRIRAHYSILRDGNCVRQMQTCRIPTLFIHGASDTFVPFSMLQQVYDAAPCEKERLVIEGAGHGEAQVADPETYWRTVFAFIGKHTV